MKRLIIVMLIQLQIVFISIVWGQEITSTPQPVQSIFDYDICAPPCWMGLVAGESISTDVDIALQILDEIDLLTWLSEPIDRGDNIDNDTGVVSTGGYGFHVGQYEPDPSGLTSRIEIRDGRVDLMVIDAHESIPLVDVLERLGRPDLIMLHVDASNITRIVLIYQEYLLRVNLSQATDTCQTSSIPTEMNVTTVIYFSPDAALRLRTYDHSIPQPDLIGFRSPRHRNIPLDQWQSWLDGEVDMSCEEAWELLPEPEVTPVVEMTTEPVPTVQTIEEGE